MINLLLALAIDVTGSQVSADDYLFLPWKDIPPNATSQGGTNAVAENVEPRVSSAAEQDAEPPDVPNMPCRLSSSPPPDRSAAEDVPAVNSPLASGAAAPALSPSKANPEILVKTVYLQPPSILAVLASLLSLLDIYLVHRHRIK